MLGISPCLTGVSPSASAHAGALGDVWSFNMDHAYCEAICRGYKKGLLTDAEYIHLHSATNLSGMHTKRNTYPCTQHAARLYTARTSPKRNTLKKIYLSLFPDIKLNLQETDFGEFLREQENLTPKIIKNAAIQKFTDEFQCVICKALSHWSVLILNPAFKLPAFKRLIADTCARKHLATWRSS